MSQTPSAEFQARSDASAKNLDYAFVIAGWDTIYTVVKETPAYTLAGDLASFSAAKAWASVPVGVGQMAKGRPEEGGVTIAEIAVTVTDRMVGGIRSLSELLARESDLQSIGAATQLNGDLANDATTIPLDAAGTLPTSGKVYVGLECVSYSGKNGNSLTGCTRGHLLTSATPHRDNARVYTFLPSLFRRKAFLYKGYQDLPMQHWLPAFGGVIAGVEKQGPAVVFRIASTMWNTYTDGKTVAFNWNTENQVVVPTSHQLSGDFDFTADLTGMPNLGNGHHLVRIGGHWSAIKAVT